MTKHNMQLPRILQIRKDVLAKGEAKPASINDFWLFAWAEIERGGRMTEKMSRQEVWAIKVWKDKETGELKKLKDIQAEIRELVFSADGHAWSEYNEGNGEIAWEEYVQDYYVPATCEEEEVVE